ncbi:MAG TPA: hypothetical protein VF590_04165, partial [Isosphaeraceae bacterium]
RPMRSARLYEPRGIAPALVLGGLVSLAGCGGGAPPTGTQVQDIPAPVSLEGMYKSQPKTKAPKAAPKYDMPGR